MVWATIQPFSMTNESAPSRTRACSLSAVHSRNANAGRLLDALAYGEAGRVFDPVAGGTYYWPRDGTLAILTTDLGPSIPAPGLVPLGVVDTGLEALTSAGNRFQMTIGLAN